MFNEGFSYTQEQSIYPRFADKRKNYISWLTVQIELSPLQGSTPRSILSCERYRVLICLFNSLLVDSRRRCILLLSCLRKLCILYADNVLRISQNIDSRIETELGGVNILFGKNERCISKNQWLTYTMKGIFFAQFVRLIVLKNDATCGHDTLRRLVVCFWVGGISGFTSLLCEPVACFPAFDCGARLWSGGLLLWWKFACSRRWPPGFRLALTNSFS